MKIVLAPDSFKESLSAKEVCAALAQGFRTVWPNATIVEVPMADGGEGTTEAAVDAGNGKWVEHKVTGPLGETVSARYGTLDDGRTAIIEMAAAAGLPLVPKDKRDPTRTTTRGVGELIRHALDHGAQRIIIGLGGSATVDGGAGMAQALGFQLLDEHGEEIRPGGGALAALDRIEWGDVPDALHKAEVIAACDVRNPLLGANGAARVFAPQKGASKTHVKDLESGLANFADVVARDLEVDLRDEHGAGAAGGLGFGLAAFAGAKLAPGVDVIAELVGLGEKMDGADFVVTGEGKLDGQTAHGKTPAGVAARAKARGVPCIAVAGALAEGHEALYETGMTAAFALTSRPMTLEDAQRDAPELLTRWAENFARAWRAASQH